jgi:glycosyltransferase involved in cell wall biosynthesis
MSLLARTWAAARFGADLARAAALAATTRHVPTAPAAPAADQEVHFLIEGDPLRDLSPAARYRAVQFVPLLDQLGFHCRLWPSRPGKYFTAASGWQRRYRFSRHLAMAEAWLGACNQRRHRRADFRAIAGRGVVFLQRDLTTAATADLERELPLHNRHVVFDFDDAIWRLPPWCRGTAAAAHEAAGERKIATLCGLATTVIAANPHLADFARQHCAAVHVLPTVLDTDSFVPGPARTQRERLVIGWAGTSGNLHYLRPLAPALQRLVREHPFVLRIVCNRVEPHELGELSQLPHEFVSWNAVDEVARLQDFDVGIMPLDDDPWARGKAGFKLVQYMACGVPFVASPVGANPATGGADGEAGLYADDLAAWTERLAALLADAGLRRRLGQAGRQRAVAHFDRRRLAPQLATILREAARA